MDYSERFKCTLLPDDDGDKDRDFNVTNILAMYESEVKIPSRISVMDRVPDIQNQLNFGACAHFALMRIAAVFDPRIIFSPFYSYFNTRVYEFGIENVGEDRGSSLRGTLKCGNKYGWTLEELWRYMASNFALEPSDVAKFYANNKLKNKRIVYYRINSIDEIKFGMAMGYVPYLGIKITDSFYSEETMMTGLILPPEGKEHGLHGIMETCFDDDLKKGCCVVDNSWGRSVGDNGRFYMPYDVLPLILNDGWMVKFIDIPSPILQ